MNNINKIFSDFLKQIGIIILYIFLSLILSLLFIKPLESNNIVTYSIVSILMDSIILCTFIYIFRKTIVPDFYDFKKNGKKYLKDTYKYWLIGLIVMAVSNIIISSFIGSGPTNEESVLKIFKQYPVYYIFTALISAPIIEELMTRKILKDTFNYKVIYYLLSGFIFGALHLISASNINEIFYIIPYGTLGFVFAIIYTKTNNIWSNISFHIIHNLLATIITVLGIIL